MDIRCFPALCGPVIPDHRILTASHLSSHNHRGDRHEVEFQVRRDACGRCRHPVSRRRGRIDRIDERKRRRPGQVHGRQRLQGPERLQERRELLQGPERLQDPGLRDGHGSAVQGKGRRARQELIVPN